MLKSIIAFLCSEKLSGLLTPSRLMYGPSGFSGSGHGVGEKHLVHSLLEFPRRG